MVEVIGRVVYGGVEGFSTGFYKASRGLEEEFKGKEEEELQNKRKNQKNQKTKKSKKA